MEIRVGPTTTWTEIDGAAVRVWQGVTENGVKCRLYVCRVVVCDDADGAEFTRELLDLELAPEPVPFNDTLF